ncbi:MAG: hypothetical protein ACPGYY_11055, partial [Bacteroidia bacterium]
SSRIDDHVVSDEDLSATNEIQTLSIIGQNLSLTSGGTVVIPSVDTSSLSSRIDANTQAIIDTAAAIRADMSTNQGLMDTASAIRSALVDTASDLRSLINSHITEDMDTSITNEAIASVTIENDSLKITEGDEDFAVYIEDMDSTNELITNLSYTSDTLRISEADTVLKVRMVENLWEDGDSIGISDIIYARQALDAGDTVSITNSGSIGLGVSAPSERLDVDGTIRLRGIDTTTLSDTLLVVDATGVVKQTAIGDAVYNMIEMYDDAGSQEINYSGQRIKFGALEFEDSYYSHTDSSITVKRDGRYKITYRVTLEMTGNNNRSTAEHYLLNNDTEIPGSFSGTYHRNSLSNTTTGTVVKVVSLSANDVIKLNSVQTSGTGTLETKLNGSSILIEFIKP